MKDNTSQMETKSVFLTAMNILLFTGQKAENVRIRRLNNVRCSIKALRPGTLETMIQNLQEATSAQVRYEQLAGPLLFAQDEEDKRGFYLVVSLPVRGREEDKHD